MLVVSATEGVHQILTSLGKTTEEYKCFGSVEGGEVSAGATEKSTRKFKDVECNLVTLFCSLEHIKRSNLIWIDVTQGRGF